MLFYVGGHLISFKEGLRWPFLWEKWYSVTHCPLSMLWNNADKLFTNNDHCSLPAKEKPVIWDLNITSVMKCHYSHRMCFSNPTFKQKLNAMVTMFGLLCSVIGNFYRFYSFNCRYFSVSTQFKMKVLFTLLINMQKL